MRYLNIFPEKLARTLTLGVRGFLTIAVLLVVPHHVEAQMYGMHGRIEIYPDRVVVPGGLMDWDQTHTLPGLQRSSYVFRYEELGFAYFDKKETLRIYSKSGEVFMLKKGYFKDMAPYRFLLEKLRARGLLQMEFEVYLPPVPQGESIALRYEKSQSAKMYTMLFLTLFMVGCCLLILIPFFRNFDVKKDFSPIFVLPIAACLFVIVCVIMEMVKNFRHYIVRCYDNVMILRRSVTAKEDIVLPYDRMVYIHYLPKGKGMRIFAPVMGKMEFFDIEREGVKEEGGYEAIEKKLQEKGILFSAMSVS